MGDIYNVEDFFVFVSVNLYIRVNNRVRKVLGSEVDPIKPEHIETFRTSNKILPVAIDLVTKIARNKISGLRCVFPWCTLSLHCPFEGCEEDKHVDYKDLLEEKEISFVDILPSHWYRRVLAECTLLWLSSSDDQKSTLFFIDEESLPVDLAEYFPFKVFFRGQKADIVGLDESLLELEDLGMRHLSLIIKNFAANSRIEIKQGEKSISVEPAGGSSARITIKL